MQKLRKERVPRAVIIAPIWPNQPWYPLILENLVDFPIHLPGSPDLLSNPAGEAHPLVLSDEALQIIIASWRPGTEKSYSSAWKKWSCWCSQRGIDPFPDSVTPVVEFLTSQFQEGKQYLTMNSYRSALSALSATLPPMEGHPVGQHPLVCRLLQGMFNKRPPAPRYGVWRQCCFSSNGVWHLRICR